MLLKYVNFYWIFRFIAGTLKKHRYPPEGMEDAVQTVMTQCELWTDHADMEEKDSRVVEYSYQSEGMLSMVAEDPVPYGNGGIQ